MLSNLIIFTTGSSGSSVLAGLIAKQGYWIGDETKKLSFNTYENAELVDLNMRLLAESGFKKRDCNDLPPPSIDAIGRLAARIDPAPFQTFLGKCENHRPWLWKDPRLAFTIHFWDKLSDFKGVKFIFIERDPTQSYSGLILKRKVPMSFKELMKINRNYKRGIDKFLKKGNLPLFQTSFEQLLCSPELTLQRINKYLGTQIIMENLMSIYKGPLYRLRYSRFDYIKARLGYLVYRYIRSDYIKFPRGNN